MKYVIDGLFLTQRVTGIQRYAIELVKELDLLIDPGELDLLVPNGADTQIVLRNIRVEHYGNNRGIRWQQQDLPVYLRKNKVKGIYLCNAFPISYPHGIVTIHDVCCRAHSEYFTGLRAGLSSAWYRKIYAAAARSDMTILTVSEFSKNEIMKYYHVPDSRIHVIYNGWQHMINIRETENVFDKYCGLKPHGYYFSMASIMPNKNFKWILNAAKNSPGEIFAIAGGSKIKSAMDAEGFSDNTNIKYLGYVNDSDAKALMKNCKAFIYPSFYEGFGIPPMEAAACGCRSIILSEIPALVEIYGDSAQYIDPNVSAQKMNSPKTCDSLQELLSKYSWKDSAKKLYQVILNGEGC